MQEFRRAIQIESLGKVINSTNEFEDKEVNITLVNYKKPNHCEVNKPLITEMD